MRFEIVGTANGQPVTVAWEDGRLSGSQWVLELIVLAAYQAEVDHEYLGPEPAGTEHNLLDNPFAARIIIERVLETVTERRGELPSGEVPPGAMA